MYGKIDWNNSTYIPQHFVKLYKNILLKEKDIVLALNRPITHNLVKVARLSKNDIPSFLYQRVGKVEFKNNYILSDFFFSYLNGSGFRSLLFRILIGSDQPYVKTTELLKQKVVFPKNTNEQARIASILSGVDATILCFVCNRACKARMILIHNVTILYYEYRFAEENIHRNDNKGHR